eukprot:scaffold46376_cov47-Phaeocystis_antarctica.AAC.1
MIARHLGHAAAVVTLVQHGIESVGRHPCDQCLLSDGGDLAEVLEVGRVGRALGVSLCGVQRHHALHIRPREIRAARLERGHHLGTLGRAPQPAEEGVEEGLVVRGAHPVEGILSLPLLEEAHGRVARDVQRLVRVGARARVGGR